MSASAAGSSSARASDVAAKRAPTPGAPSAPASGEGLPRFAPWLLVVLVLAVQAYLALCIYKPWGVFFGAGDMGGYGFGEMFFRKNFGWWPLPHVTLWTDEIAYPYGIEFVAHGWSLERHYFTTALRALFEVGPWLQTYALLGQLVGVIGTAMLTRKQLEPWPRALVLLAVSCFSFAAWCKYPAHMNLSIIHWAVLGIVADALWYRHLLAGTLTVRRVAWRVALLFAVLGLDIGYVAGLSLTSFTVFCVAALAHRAGPLASRAELARVPARWWHDLGLAVRAVGSEWHARPAALVAPLIVTLGLAYLYLPILAHVVLRFGAYSFGHSGIWWANPLRLVLPWFPGVPEQGPFITQILSDSPEMQGAMSPGWTLTFPAALGAWCIVKRRLRVGYPLLALVALLLAYHPENFPVLKALPWFRELRVAGRVSLVFPVLFALIAGCGVPPWVAERMSRGEGARRRLRLLAIAWALCAVAELAGFAHLHRFMQPVAAAPLLAYTSAVRAAPGSALLEWPLCVAGGNGVGTRQFCPLYGRNEVTMGLADLHDKKLVNFYLGRVARSQLSPLYEAGWSSLLRDGSDDGERYFDKLPKCLDEAGFAFFARFLALGDFAGLQLYPDLLPAGCPQEFYARFGAPCAETTLPGPGRVQFIARPAALAGQTDLAAARQLQYLPDLAPGRYSLTRSLAALDVSKLGDERDIAPWGMHGVRKVRPQALRVGFAQRAPATVGLELSLYAGLAEQRVTLLLDGRVLGDTALAPCAWTSVRAPPALLPPGRHVFEVRFAMAPSVLGALSAGLGACRGDGLWRHLRQFSTDNVAFFGSGDLVVTR